MPWALTSGAASNGTGNVTPGVPTGYASGDFLFIVTESYGGQAVAPPAGWTEEAWSPIDQTDTRLHVFWKRASGSESAPTVLDSGDHTISQMFMVKGVVGTGSPFRNVTGSTGAASATGDFDAVAADLGDFVVMILGHGRDNSGSVLSGEVAFTNIDYSSQRTLENVSNTGNGGGFLIAAGAAESSATCDASCFLAATVATNKISFSLIPDGSQDEITISRVGLGGVVDTTGGVMAIARTGLGAVVDVDGNNYRSYLAASRVGVGFVVYPDPSTFKRRWRANVN